MRLICPSCQAHYEIDATLLPREGREVQCSACDFIWFQVHEDAGLAPDVPKTGDTNTELMFKDRQLAVAEGALPEAALPESDSVPRTVSGAALDILREEAAFEARQRAAEMRAENTAAPNADIAPSWPSTAQKPPPKTPRSAPDSATKPGPAHFPDIDDFSAGLDPLGDSSAHQQGAHMPASATTTLRSFLRGFALPVLLAGLAAVPYILAPELGAALPAAEAALSGYVAAVDAVRMKLAGWLAG